MILTEYFWTFQWKNCIVGMLLTCPVENILFKILPWGSLNSDCRWAADISPPWLILCCVCWPGCCDCRWSPLGIPPAACVSNITYCYTCILLISESHTITLTSYLTTTQRTEVRSKDSDTWHCNMGMSWKIYGYQLCVNYLLSCLFTFSMSATKGEWSKFSKNQLTEH